MNASRRMWRLVAALVAVALLGIALQPVTQVTVATNDGDVLACRRVGPDATVTLVFTHSMYGGEVRETWRVVGDTLVRAGIEADRAAAAEYFATDGAVERTAGGFAVVSPPLALKALPVRVDQVGRHRLRFEHGDEVSLADRVEGSAAAAIGIRRNTAIQQLVRGCPG